MLCGRRTPNAWLGVGRRCKRSALVRGKETSQGLGRRTMFADAIVQWRTETAILTWRCTRFPCYSCSPGIRRMEEVARKKRENAPVAKLILPRHIGRLRSGAPRSVARLGERPVPRYLVCSGMKRRERREVHATVHTAYVLLDHPSDSSGPLR